MEVPTVGWMKIMIYDQAEFDICCEWGEQGVTALAPISDAVIIVDVMSFSSAVVIATARGARVYPYRGAGDAVGEFAASVGAELAGHRGQTGYSLSPISLMSIPGGTRLVLPSPNGSTLTFATGNTPTFAGCLRNAKAVAQAASRCGKKVAVIPCGERWRGDRSLRPAFEDLVGAGAIIGHLGGTLSPEARAAVGAYRYAEADMLTALRQCSSGKELIAKGYEQDVHAVAEIDVDDCAPVLKDGAYIKAQ